MIRKSAIVSISKTRLSIIEKKILKKYKPWGIILFSRNIKSSDQLRRLTKEIRIMSDINILLWLMRREGQSLD